MHEKFNVREISKASRRHWAQSSVCADADPIPVEHPDVMAGGARKN